MNETKLLTVGLIAKQLNLPIHKVLYLITSRNIRPIQRAGSLRVFSEDTIDILRAEMKTDRRHHFVNSSDQIVATAEAI